MPTVVKNGWYEEAGNLYWYENDVKQGLEGRGKEIWDPGSDAWYWLDSNENGRMAINKDVYMEAFLEFLKTDSFMLISFCFEIVLGIISIVAVVLLCKLNREYKDYMKKMGNGNTFSLKTNIPLKKCDMWRNSH